MTKHSTSSTPAIPPPDVPLDQTKAQMDWEGREPPSAKKREAWDFRLIEFLARKLGLAARRPD